MSRPSVRATVTLNAADRLELRPFVERLAVAKLADRMIAERVSTPQRPVNSNQVALIRRAFGIAPGVATGRPRRPRPLHVPAPVPPPRTGPNRNELRVQRLAAARAALRPQIDRWVARRCTDREIAALLNATGEPTLSGLGVWTHSRVESYRRQEGIRSLCGPNPPVKARFRPPAGHRAHCCVCDAPVDHDGHGRAELHQRLTSMVVAATLRAGRCEGSNDPVVCRPDPDYALGVTA